MVASYFSIYAFEALKEELSNIHLAPENLRFQKASSTALIAFEKYNNNETLTSAELMPVYLRLPQAQRELKKKMEEKK